MLLVRHGQASFGKSDYDRLSEDGHRQARLLGEDLARRGWRPERIIGGNLRRQQETIAEIAVGAGWDLEPEVDPAWNELDHEAVISAFKPAYRSMLLLKADMVRTLRPRAAFEEMFEAAIMRWASGEHDVDYPESFAAFRQRVDGALDRALDQAPSQQLVVSSIGCISRVAARLVDGGSIQTWKQFSFSGANTGVSRIVLDRRGPQLLSFNEISHLDGSGLLSQR